MLMDACNAIYEDSVSKFTGKAVLVHYEFKNCSLYKKVSVNNYHIHNTTCIRAK